MNKGTQMPTASAKSHGFLPAKNANRVAEVMIKKTEMAVSSHPVRESFQAIKRPAITERTK